ncbi:hypothetical protein [Pedobacter sp. Leaf176]|uniref:hypothetical protein n=1 Tax=Pedobacter sp. Leaf176 TaxID=1736286 RepID=UPI0007013B02|nr:hypothetical protein [Pedobacter sp. Leaf176]KQR72326.1 hypothetical protein ASF92_03275 [Pedobacter sp. Leaf176]
MKTLFILPLTIILSCSLAQKEVYICNNGKTTKYHLKEACRGLSNCSYKIVKTTLEKATKDKKTLCGWEK